MKIMNNLNKKIQIKLMNNNKTMKKLIINIRVLNK